MIDQVEIRKISFKDGVEFSWHVIARADMHTEYRDDSERSAKEVAKFVAIMCNDWKVSIHTETNEFWNTEITIYRRQR